MTQIWVFGSFFYPAQRPRCFPKYERNLLKIGFKTPTFRFFRDFQPLKRLLHTSSQMANIGQFLAKKAKKAFRTFFSLLKALINCKVSEKSNEGIPRKMRKTSIFGYFGPKWPILDSFFFSKNPLEKFFRLSEF